MGIKRKAKRNIPVEASDSEETKSMQEALSQQKKQKKEDGQGSNVEITSSKEKKKGDDQTKGEKNASKEEEPAKKKKVKAGDQAESEKKERQSQVPEPKSGIKIKTVAKKGKSPLKKKETGKNTIPSSWFLEDSDFKTWKEGFSSLPVTKCFLMEQELIDKLHTVEYVKALKGSKLWKLVNPEYSSYPRLTRLFYLNLRSERVDGKQVLESRVAGVDITLNHKVFSEVLELGDFEEKELPAREFALKSARKQFILETHQHSKKQLTHTVLNCEAKILFNVLVRFILPKETSRELITDKTLELMWLIVSGYEIDVAKVVMEHMVITGGRTRKHAMPYSNLLPIFFSHFGVPLEEEEEVDSDFESFGEEALQRIGLAQSGKGKWVFYEDLTAEDFSDKKYVKPRSSSKTAGNANVDQVMSRLDELEETVLMLKEDFFELNKVVSSFRDSIEEKLDLMIKGLHLEKVTSMEESEEKEEETLGSQLEKLKKKKKKEESMRKAESLKKKDLEKDESEDDEEAEAEDQDTKQKKKTEKKSSEEGSSNL